MLNTVTLMGRLTKDPELRSTASNVSVTSFSIACERDFKGSNGEKQTDFFECVAWRNTAEYIAQYFTKGRMIIVDGSLQTRTWEDKNGSKHKAVDIIVANAYFGDSKKESDEAPRNNPSKGTFIDVDDEDLPF